MSHPLYDKMVSIRPAQPWQVEELTRLAAAKQHHVLLPTSVLMKDKQIKGYLSIGAVPTVLAWLDTTLSPRDAVHTFGFIEDVVSHYNAPAICMPVNAASPFHTIAADAGYIDTGLHTIYIKSLAHSKGKQ